MEMKSFICHCVFLLLSLVSVVLAHSPITSDEPISSPQTVEYKRFNSVPLAMDIYTVGSHLVTNVSEACLEELVKYCPESYNRDPTCSKCINVHKIHIMAAGCPQDLFLIQNLYCGTKPGQEVGGPVRKLGKSHDELRPLIIYIHGGGWSKESKNEIPDYVRQLAEANRYVLASIDYRLTSQADVFGGVTNVIWPAQNEDVMDAFTYLHDNAKDYGIDPRKRACLGTSAGAHLCSLGVAYAAQYTAVPMQAAIAMYPPTNLVDMMLDVNPAVGCRVNHDAVDSFESRLLGSAITNISIGEIRANWHNTSNPWPVLVALANTTNPVTYIDQKTPPMFVAHGSNDTLVPYNQSLRLVHALQRSGVEVGFSRAEGCNHASEPRDCWQSAVEDMQRWVAAFFK